jgi:hypothetical protein
VTLVQQAREGVIVAALGVATARAYDELHPDDPHGGDQVDLAQDVLDDALREYGVAFAREADA